MTIRLHDNQGRDWTVEGDWSAQVMGADFGKGTMMVWLKPDEGGHLSPMTEQPGLPTPAAPPLAAAPEDRALPPHDPTFPDGEDDDPGEYGNYN